MKLIILLGLLIVAQQANAIDLERLKMYKQQDIEYNERQKRGFERHQDKELTSNFQNDNTNFDEGDSNSQSNISFPKVAYTYADITSILNTKLYQYTERSKVFEALQQMTDQEQEFQTTLEKLKLKQGELRLVTVQAQERIYYTLEDQELKAEKMIQKLNLHLDGLKKQINLKTQFQAAIKDRVFDLEGMKLIWIFYKRKKYLQ